MKEPLDLERVEGYVQALSRLVESHPALPGMDGASGSTIILLGAVLLAVGEELVFALDRIEAATNGDDH